MKTIYFILCMSILFISCEPKVDNSANEAFDKNSETVLANLKNWESETPDYSQYADDFVMRGTSFGSSDSLSLAEMKQMDSQTFAIFDFEIASDSINLLPGVNAVTKMTDGSVRHYTDWRVILPATDSTEERSGVIKIYESFDFDAEGKILYQQSYGDFGGIMDYLDGADEDDDDNDDED